MRGALQTVSQRWALDTGNTAAIERQRLILFCTGSNASLP
jgi:hypothetical protein